MLTIVRRRWLIVMLAALIALPGVVPAVAQEATADGEGDLRSADTTTIELGELRPLALSPDGQRLAVTSSDELCVIDVAGEAVNEQEPRCADLRGPDLRIDLDPDSLHWSPDSSRLAFTETSFRTFMDGDLWIMDAGAGSLTNLTDDGVAEAVSFTGAGVDDPVAHIDVAPAWSPDSEAIAFARSTVRDGEWDGTALYQVRVTGDGSATPQRITQISSEMPGLAYLGVFWTPDGERIIYPVLHPVRDHILNGIWYVGLADGQPRRLLNFDAELGRAIPYGVSATSEHALILYVDAFVRLEDEVSTFALVDLTTGQLTPVEAAAGWPMAATFSPDGRRLLYATADLDADTGQLIVRDVATGAEQTLVPALAERVRSVSPMRGLDWAEDGTVLLLQNDAVSLLQLAGEGAVAPLATAAIAISSAPTGALQGDLQIVDSEPLQLDEAFLLSISPDGRRLLTIEAADDARTLCVVPTAVTLDRRCVEFPLGEREINLDPGSVVWSPDSSRLAFAEFAFPASVDGDLWLMDAESGMVTNLTDDGFVGPLPYDDGASGDDEVVRGTALVDVSPVWSPDGQALAFVRSTFQDGAWIGTALYQAPVTAVASAAPELIAQITMPVGNVDSDLRQSPANGVRWSPDGERLFYVVSNPGLSLQNGLWYVDRAEGSPRRLAVPDPDLGPPLPGMIAASGELMLIVYEKPYSNLLLGVEDGEAIGSPYALLDLVTGEVTRIEAATGIPMAATLSPDGQRLLYVAADATTGGGQLVLRELATGAEQVLLSSLEGRIADERVWFGLAWLTDGTVVLWEGGAATLLRLDGEGAVAPSVDPGATASPISSVIRPGLTVVTATPDVSLRAAPAPDATIVASLAAGADLEVLDEPVIAAGETWIPVRDPATRTIGYVRAADLSIDENS